MELLDLKFQPEFHPITLSRYYSLGWGENDSKQSDEFQAT